MPSNTTISQADRKAEGKRRQDEYAIDVLLRELECTPDKRGKEAFNLQAQITSLRRNYLLNHGIPYQYYKDRAKVSL